MILLYATYICKVFTPFVAKHLIILLYATYICKVLAPWFQRSCGQYSNATSGVADPPVKAVQPARYVVYSLSCSSLMPAILHL